MKVAGFWKWKELGRSVKKSEKGIRILAPIIGIRRKKEEEAHASKDPAAINKAVLVGFRSAYVFDRLSRDLRPAAGLPREPAQPGVRHHGDRVKPSKSGRIRRSVNGRFPCE
jgi:hypothetical protein